MYILVNYIIYSIFVTRFQKHTPILKNIICKLYNNRDGDIYAFLFIC